jgi:hypothetical protein
MSHFALLLILLICLFQLIHSAKDYWSESFDEGKIFDLKKHVNLSPLLLNLLPKPNYFWFYFRFNFIYKLNLSFIYQGSMVTLATQRKADPEFFVTKSL